MNTVIDSLFSVDVDVDEDVNEPDTPLDISDLDDLDDMQNDQNVINVKKKLIQNRKLQHFEQRKKRK